MFWNGQRATEPPQGWSPTGWSPTGWTPPRKRRWYQMPRWVKILAAVVFWPLTLAAGALAGAVVVARWSLAKERRAVCAPGWLLLIAATSWWLLPAPAWWWALLGLALDVTTVPAVAAQWDRMSRPWLSERERQLFARTCAGIALVMVATGPAPVLPRGMFLMAAVAAGSIYWWKGRRIRPSDRPRILDRWDDEVVPHEPRLAGKWVEFDEERGVGRLRLDNCTANEAAGLDEAAEWALEQHRGTITIAADPRLTVREVRVAFTDHEYGSRLRLFDGSTLTPDGRFVMSYAKGAVPLYGRLWWEEGGLGIGVIAPPGRGKGSVQRLLAVTAALSDQVEMFGACGKQGQGIGYLRDACRIFTDTHEESVDLIHGFLMAVRERARRYGRMGRDSFIPEEGDPRLMLMVDEPGWIFDYEPRVADWFEEITGTQRSAGASLCISIHKGDGPGWGSTKVRSNIITNGWRALGAMDDNQAKNTGLQGADVDLSTVPDEPGWFVPIGRLLGGQPLIPGRVLFIPNHGDLAKHRIIHPDKPVTPEEFAPFGFVEDWLTKTIHPEIHPETLKALGTPDPVQQMRREMAARQAAAEGDEGAEEGAAHLSLVDSTPAPADAWTRIQSVLQEVHPDGLLRGQIAERSHVSPRHVTDTLNARAARFHDVVKDEKSRWRLAS